MMWRAVPLALWALWPGEHDRGTGGSVARPTAAFVSPVAAWRPNLPGGRAAGTQRDVACCKENVGVFMREARAAGWQVTVFLDMGTPRRERRAGARGTDSAHLRRGCLTLLQEAGAGHAVGSADGLLDDQEAAGGGRRAHVRRLDLLASETEAQQTAALKAERAAAQGAVESHVGRKTIGVDYGRKRTGVCVSVGYAPRPLPLICHDDNCTDVAQHVAKIAKREGAEQIVVGFPFNSTGGEGEQAMYTRQFVRALQEACPTCAIFLWDERFSTSDAREKLQQVSDSSR